MAPEPGKGVNIERRYYEIDGFWTEGAIRETDRSRVGALAELIPTDVQTVLELGCGNGILVNALRSGARPYERIVGLDRSLAALRHVQVERVCASVDALPLPDRAFDLVAAPEVIEHLPVAVYDAALAEACRASRRYVMISVPYRQNLRAELIECPSCRSRFNPDYHMRSFDEAGIQKLLERFSFRCTLSRKLGTHSRYRGVDRIRSFRRNGSAGNPFAVAIPCPVCGFELPAGSSRPDTGARPATRSPLRRIVKSVWPTSEEHNWLAALYERTDVR